MWVKHVLIYINRPTVEHRTESGKEFVSAFKTAVVDTDKIGNNDYIIFTHLGLLN